MIPTNLDILFDDGVAMLDLQRRFDPEDLAPPNVPGWRSTIGDLARLRAGWRPDKYSLNLAPRLAHWSVSPINAVGLFNLVGIVTGHPRLPDHRQVSTSLLIALDTGNLRWARTLSRFYVLGPPAGER